MDISYLVANARDKEGNLLARVDELYDELIPSSDSKYRNQSLVNKNRVICPFHDDVKPSLGVIEARSTGMQLFNCFGCGKKGNVVHFYIFYNREYKDRELTTEEATMELAEKYGIEIDEDYNKEIVKTVESRKINIINKENEYSIRDYQQDCKNLSLVLDTEGKDAFASYMEELQLHWLEHGGKV